MLENLGIVKRSFSLEDAAKYLTEKLKQPVFINDLIKLAEQKKLKLSCQVTGVAGRKVIQFCKPNFNDHLKEVFPLSFKPSFSFLPSSEPSQRVIKNLRGQKWETNPVTLPEQHDKHKGVSFRFNKNLATWDLPYLTGFGGAVWLEGVYEIVITECFQKWLSSAVLPSSPVFDLDDFTLVDERGEPVKIAGYTSNGHKKKDEEPHQALVRLEVSDLKVQLQHILEFLELLQVQKTNTSHANKSKPSYLELRKIVAQVYVKKKTQEYIRSLSTVELWDELYQTAKDMFDPKIDPEILFKRTSENNTIEKEFVKLRKLGVAIPIRR